MMQTNLQLVLFPAVGRLIHDPGLNFKPFFNNVANSGVKAVSVKDLYRLVFPNTTLTVYEEFIVQCQIN